MLTLDVTSVKFQFILVALAWQVIWPAKFISHVPLFFNFLGTGEVFSQKT